MKMADVAEAQPAALQIDLYDDIREVLTQALHETLARLTSRENLEQLLMQVGVKGPTAPKVANRLPVPATSPEVLTARELEILTRISRGESNKAIARTLDLSVHTVKRHVANILGKLGVSSRVQAATWLSVHH